MEEFEWVRANDNIVRRVWKYHVAKR